MSEAPQTKLFGRNGALATGSMAAASLFPAPSAAATQHQDVSSSQPSHTQSAFAPSWAAPTAGEPIKLDEFDFTNPREKDLKSLANPDKTQEEREAIMEEVFADPQFDANNLSYKERAWLTQHGAEFVNEAVDANSAMINELKAQAKAQEMKAMYAEQIREAEQKAQEGNQLFQFLVVQQVVKSGEVLDGFLDGGPESL